MNRLKEYWDGIDFIKYICYAPNPPYPGYDMSQTMWVDYVKQRVYVRSFSPQTYVPTSIIGNGCKEIGLLYE
jgi:hypothetical protein